MKTRATVRCICMAALAALTLPGCATAISPNRADFVVVEGKVELRGWDCGTVARPSSGYFYVCDMPLQVQRVVYGQHTERSITARFFVLEVEEQNPVVTGPHVTRDRRAAAILWPREDGTVFSFVLLPFPGRWCVPDWMASERNLDTEDVARLRRAGYPLCSVDSEP
jgi:hypothetical protein